MCSSSVIGMFHPIVLFIATTYAFIMLIVGGALPVHARPLIAKPNHLRGLHDGLVKMLQKSHLRKSEIDFVKMSIRSSSSISALRNISRRHSRLLMQSMVGANDELLLVVKGRSCGGARRVNSVPVGKWILAM